MRFFTYSICALVFLPTIFCHIVQNNFAHSPTGLHKKRIAIPLKIPEVLSSHVKVRILRNSSSTFKLEMKNIPVSFLELNAVLDGTLFVFDPHRSSLYTGPQKVSFTGDLPITKSEAQDFFIRMRTDEGLLTKVYIPDNINFDISTPGGRAGKILSISIVSTIFTLSALAVFAHFATKLGHCK